MTAISTAAFASNLSRPQETTAPKRNNFIDYSTNNKESEVAFTAKVEMRATAPTLSADLGSIHFTPDEEHKFTPGELLDFATDYIPALSGEVILSDRNSGVMLTLNVAHYNVANATNGFIAKENSAIYLTQTLVGTETQTAYARVNSTLINEMTNVQVAFGGFSLQYKNFSIGSFLGAAIDHMNLETHIKGIDSENESLINTFANNQNSMAYGIATKITPSIILYDSEFSSMYLTAELGLTAQMSENNGNVVSYQSDLETEDLQFTSNTSLDGTTFVNGCSKKLALALVSKPQENDSSFFTMQLGIGSNTLYGKDIIAKAINGRAGDISSTFAFLSIAYTM